MLKHCSLVLFDPLNDTLPPSLISLFSSCTISEECLEFLLEHDLSDLFVRSFNIDKFFIALDLISLFDSHLSLGLDSLHITAVGSLEIRVSNEIVDVDVLLIVCL